MDYRTCLRLVCLLLLFCALPVSAQTLTSSSSLSFGSFSACTGGTITVSSVGLRSKTGAVMLVNQGTAASAAQLLITGTLSSGFAISLPADGMVTLTSGSNSMALNGFTSNPMSSGMLGSGSQMISVGAILTVGSGQAPGNYSGTFSVTVVYD